MTASVVLEYAEFLYDRTVGRAIPLRFAKYCVVGAAGALVHLAVLYAGMRVLALTRGAALAAAIEAAIVFNFALNNRWTFSDYVVRGPRTLPVFLRYNLVCSIGALSAYSVGVVLAGRGLGTAPAYAAGAIVGAIWNYSMAKMFTWKASG
jgi:dolichol-phosphate mannosyltransferase